MTTIDMKKTNRKGSDNKRTTTIVKHLEENTDQYEFKCKTCNRRFKYYQALGGHTVSSHKKIKPENKYNDALGMSSLNTKPSVSSMLHQCKICKKEFENRQALAGHMNKHRIDNGLLNAKPTVSSMLHQCKICTKEFKNRQALAGHMNKHRSDNGLLHVVEESGPSTQQEAEKVESDFGEFFSGVATVELERRKAEEDERVRLRRELILAGRELRLAYGLKTN